MMDLSYDDLYGSDAVSRGIIRYCNMGMHPVDIESIGNPKTHDMLQPHQQQLYITLLSLPRVMNLIEKASIDNDPIHVLDVGCGIGSSIQLIHQFISKHTTSPVIVIGIEKNHVAMKQHKRLYHGDKRLLHYDMEYQRLSAISRHRFDLVVGVQSFQEMKNAPHTVVAELKRIVKPQGLVVLADFYNKGNAFGTDFLSILQQSQDFDLHYEKDVSYHATLAAKQGTTKLQDVLDDMVPREFHENIAALLTLKKSPRYEAVRLGTLQFGIFGFHSLYHPSHDDRKEVHLSDDEYEEDDIDDSMNPSYYDYKTLFPELEILRENTDIIREEAMAAQLMASWPNWPENHYIGDKGEWKVFPLCYTFPAWDASKTVWVEATCAQCPETVAVLKKLPGLRTALFSNLGPNTKLAPHRGWADLANDILRVHLGLVIPSVPNVECCCVVVSGEARAHRTGELIVFDDSKQHSAFNLHPTDNRFVLILDMYRPDHLPRGKAIGGHTDELDRFIEQYSASLDEMK